MKEVFWLRLVFVLVVVMLMTGLVLGQGIPLNDCLLEEYDAITNTSHARFDELNSSYVLTGYVSMQAHYSNELFPGVIDYPYGVFCDNRLVINRDDAQPTFYFSDPLEFLFEEEGVLVNGSGHVSFYNETVSFNGEAFHGFTGSCRVVGSGNSCASHEVCVLKISNPDQGSVADCNDEFLPYFNSFQNRICCAPTEYCRDGIDNTGDGLVDCQSPECHANVLIGTRPQRCDPHLVPGNAQRTLDCVDVENSEPGNVVFFDHCLGPDSLYDMDVGFFSNPWPVGFPDTYNYPDVSLAYYCNYGEIDNPDDEPVGRCCPYGQWYDQSRDNCVDFIPCDTLYCPYNFMNQFEPWLASLYDDNPWCHSHLPLFTTRTVTRSDACCPVVTHGTFGYYILDDNVKIFGAE
ncbi:hypothetical protein KO361_05890 [Candidatus Woesearchaeota archaeon]|nr:hypothetical protein [Candidatus Woesearchaeota archaeon]